MEYPQRRALAVVVLRSLDGASPQAVRLLASALTMAGGAAGEFATAFDYYADALEHDDVTGSLAEIKMAYSLKVAARHPDCDALLERLDGAESPPWPFLREALLEVGAELGEACEAASE